MILGEDFKFRDDMDKHDTVPIELLTGPYKGVIMRFREVKVTEQEDESATLKFDYELFETAGMTEDQIRGDARFQEHVGLILNAMILEVIEDRTRDTDQ